MSNIIHSPEREKDVMELCDQVLNIFPERLYNSNGPDETICPFCLSNIYGSSVGMHQIEHKSNCAYLIAKDLTTNKL